MRSALLPLLLAGAAPLAAQDHSGHQPVPAEQPAEPSHESHEGHGESAATPAAPQAPAMDHEAMNHEAMDHAGGHGTGRDGDQAANIDPPEGPPSPEAFAGPAYAADEAVGADKMNAARLELMREVSGMPVAWLQAERLEYRAHDGEDGYLWDVQGYYGGDYEKLWLKSEGEGAFGEELESAEVQALWSHAISPWFDLQTGVRQDFAGPERTHAVIGVQGLAPYMFEVDAAAFLSTKGDLTARIETELDQRITQRLILQPRLELALSAQDIPELGIGAGLDTIEAGLRLRYEIVREFAPYIGVAQEWKVGDSADFARAAGEDPSRLSFVVGLRAWF